MQVEALLILLLIGAVAGFLAGLIVKGYGFGVVGNIIVGIVGAVFGGWLLPQLGLFTGGDLMVRSSRLLLEPLFCSSLLVLCGGLPEASDRAQAANLFTSAHQAA